MAITLKQVGNTVSSGLVYPHDKKNPAFYIADSSQVGNYIDFKYVFVLTDYEGTITTYNATPTINGYGYFDANKYISKKLNTEYSNSISYFRAVYDYKVTVQEFYNGSLQGVVGLFTRGLLAERTDNEDRNIYPNAWKQMRNFLLSNALEKNIRQDRNTEAYTCVYNASRLEDGYITSIGHIDVYYEALFDTGYKWRFELQLSNYYDFTAGVGSALESSTSGAFVPVGIKTLETTSLNRLGYWDLSNVWHSSTGAATGIYDVPSFGGDIISFEVWKFISGVEERAKYTITNCDNKIITAHWINQVGGYDFMNFNKYRTDRLKTVSDEYNASNYADWQQINDNDNHNVHKIGIQQQYTFDLITDYLTLDEINYLKSLWGSEKVYLSIDGVIVPVNIVDKTEQIYRKDKSKLFQYKVSFEYALR